MRHVPLILTIASCACFPAFALLMCCCKVSSLSDRKARLCLREREMLRRKLWRGIVI